MSNTREITRIACKLLGLLFLVWGISSFPLVAHGIVSVIQKNQTPAISPVGYIVIPFFYLIAAAIFLKYPEEITGRLIKPEQETQPASTASWQKGFYEICLRLIGIYVVVHALPEIINQGLRILSFSQSQPTLPLHIWAGSIGTLIYLVFGIHLLSGGKLFTRLAENLSGESSHSVSEPS